MARRKIVGATDATRGCKHRCRHCPIVPVYDGQFRVVPVDVVMADIRAQVEQGATHISVRRSRFLQRADARAARSSKRCIANSPALTYDAIIKVEHLLAHRELLPVLAATGCLFVTSAVESVDDEVLAKLEKGHTRADFIAAAALCRDARPDAGADLRRVHAVDDDRRLHRSAATSSTTWTWWRTSRRCSGASACWSRGSRGCSNCRHPGGDRPVRREDADVSVAASRSARRRCCSSRSWRSARRDAVAKRCSTRCELAHAPWPVKLRARSTCPALPLGHPVYERTLVLLS